MKKFKTKRLEFPRDWPKEMHEATMGIYKAFDVAVKIVTEWRKEMELTVIPKTAVSHKEKLLALFDQLNEKKK